MDVSALTQQYRSCREKQRTELQLVQTDCRDLLGPIRTVPIRTVPVAQGWTSPWEPGSPSPVVPLESDPKMSDPWHDHLDLHRRRPADNRQTEARSCRCCGSLSSEVSTPRFSMSDHLCSSTDTPSLCEEHPVRLSSGSGSSDGSSEGSSGSCGLDEAPGSADPPDGSSGRTTERVPQQAEIQCSGSSSTHRDQNQEMDRSPGTGAVRSSRTCQHLQGPSSQQLRSERPSQNHYPFPSRRTPKRSEAARRLGLYSSF